MEREVDVAANDRAAFEHVLAHMPRFTLPVTLEDLRAYRGILATRLEASGFPSGFSVEVKRNGDGPIVVRVAANPRTSKAIVAELTPLAV